MPASTDVTASSYSKTVSREELYDLAWREPMLRLGERFGVSSSYLARVFTELRVPRPAPGYWAQREFGKSPPRPKLPPARPGDLTEWSPGASVGTTVRSITRATEAAQARAAESPDIAEAGEQSAPQASKPTSKRNRAAFGALSHELLIGVKPLFLKTRKVENDILRPYKRLLVDVLASEAKLDDALQAAQTLFEQLNRQGLHVGFAPAGEYMPRAEVRLLETSSDRHYHHAVWAPERPTVVYVGATAIGLTLYEMTEEVEMVYVNGAYLPVRDLSAQQLRRYSGTHHWRTKKEHASGRLCLQVYCPSALVSWSRKWQETKPDEISSIIPGIVKEIEEIASQLASQLEEARRRADEERRRWDEEARQRAIDSQRLRIEKAKQDATRDLLSAIASWNEAKRVQEYFASVAAEAERLPEAQAAAVRERLQYARELVGELDPLGQLMNWKTPSERLPTR